MGVGGPEEPCRDGVDGTGLGVLGDVFASIPHRGECLGVRGLARGVVGVDGSGAADFLGRPVDLEGRLASVRRADPPKKRFTSLTHSSIARCVSLGSSSSSLQTLTGSSGS